jgi:hypothetical protein
MGAAVRAPTGLSQGARNPKNPVLQVTLASQAVTQISPAIGAPRGCGWAAIEAESL